MSNYSAWMLLGFLTAALIFILVLVIHDAVTTSRKLREESTIGGAQL
jgi:hypothetical protein